MPEVQQTLRGFVSLEGIDFTWKTPFSQWLHRDLTAQGNRVVITRDPPYYISPWTDFHEFFERGESLAKISEAFLLLTARLDNYERFIAPALKERSIVVADRYSDSWLAYQSLRLAQYFGGESEALSFLISIQNGLVVKGLLGIPALTIWISEDPEAAIARASTAEKISKYENLPLQIKVDRQYQSLARMYPERIKQINVRGLDIHGGYRLVLNTVAEHLSSMTLLNFYRSQLPKVGQRVEALKQLPYTVDEFEDFPTTVEVGELGTIVEIFEGAIGVYIKWDRDPHSHLKKGTFLDSPQDQWPIRILD